MPPRITIVTISFNQAKYLGEAIASVLDQGYPNLDYIVVDPGSTDGSRDVIINYTDQLTALLSPDDGPADGLNRGFARATGEIFGYINADDRLLPGALDRIAAHFGDPATDVILGNGVMLDAAGEVTRPVYSSRFSLSALGHGAMTFVQQGNFFRRTAFMRAGGFNAANRTCWDAELLIDMALANARIVNVPDRLGAFRLYGETITGSGRFAQQMALDNARLSAKALGRPSRPGDRLRRPLHRLWRWIGDPAATLDGVRARLAR
jgi:glycosyltransferase involved in cell wall biosynthesis